MIKPHRLIVLMTFAFALLAGSIAISRGQTGDPQGYVESLISDLVSSDGQKVQLFGLSVSLTGNVQAERVTVSDIEGAWLEIDDFTLDWDPFSLLGSVLTVNSLDISAVRLQRRPKQPPTESTSEIPPPKPVTIKRIQVDRITIAEAVAGEAAELRAGGTVNITADPARISIDTEIERIDAIAGRFSARIEYQPQTKNLDVDVRGSDGPSGLIGNLLNIPGKPKLELAVLGNGTLDAWDGTISLKTGADQALSGDIRIAAVDAGRRIGMSLQGSVSAFIPDMLQPAFGGRSALAGSVLFPAAAGPTLLEVLVLETAAVNLEISGALDTAGDNSELRIRVQTPQDDTELARTESGSVTIAAMQLDAGLSGALGDPRWTLSGRSRQISIGPDTIENIQIAGANKAAENGGSGFAVNFSGTLASDRSAPWVASLRGPIEAALTGTYGAELPLIVRSARLAVPAGQISVAGSLQPAEQIFDLQVDAKLSRLRTGVDPLDRLLSDPTNLSGRVAKAGQSGSVSLSGLNLSTPSISATLSGRIDATAIDLTTEGRLLDLSRLAEGAVGAVDFQAELSGKDLSLQAGGTGIMLSGKALDNPVLEFKGKLDPAAPKGIFALSGQYDGSPVKAGFSLDTQVDGTRSLTNLQALVAGAALSGELQLSPDNRALGRLQFNAPDLSGLGDFLLLKAEGAINGSIDIRTAGPVDQANVRASGSAIRAGGLSIDALEANVTIADIRKPSNIIGKVEASRVKQGRIDIDGLTIDAARKDAGYALDLEARGDTVSGKASILLVRQDGDLLVTLKNADLNLFQIPLRLTEQAQLTAGSDQTRIDPIRLAIASGSLEVQGSYGKSIDLRLDARDVPLSLADVFAPDIGLSGGLTGTATASGRPEAPKVNFEATVSQVSTQALQQAGLPPLNVNASGNLSGKVLTLNSRAEASGDLQLTTSGRIELTDIPRLQLKMQGSVPLVLFADQLARNGARASGLATADLDISGPVTKPEITGTADISNATFGDAAGRFIISNAAAQVRLDGDRVELVSLTGSSSGGGTVTATGQTGLSDDSQITANIIVRNGRYVDGDLVVSTFNADLNLDGNRSEGIIVGGDIVLLATTITLDSLPPAAQQLADVVHKHPPVPVARQWALLQDRRRQSGGSATRLALTIRTANPILVRGRGINADFGGRLKIAGTTDSVEPIGRFELLRGTLTIVGRQLEFDRGTLDFAGNLSPDIDISATGTTADAAVTLRLAGTVDKPRVTIQSVPELPSEEALANLVFQQSTANLSPIQIAQLADSILVLSGGTRSGLFEGLRRTAGIDRLDVRTDSEGKTSVSAGRYLNEKTYLGVEQGVEDGTTKVTIDLDITRNIKLRAGAGSAGETEAGIVFEKEY